MTCVGENACSQSSAHISPTLIQVALTQVTLTQVLSTHVPQRAPATIYLSHTHTRARMRHIVYAPQLTQAGTPHRARAIFPLMTQSKLLQWNYQLRFNCSSGN